MASQIEISNFALIALGADPISSLSEQTQEAISINIAWDISRKTLLRAHPWNFAIKRAELAQSASNPLYGYAYRYAIPSDFLRILQVYADTDYKLESGFILTNSPRAQLKYIADVKDTSQWSADFTDLMVEKLKAELAYVVTRDKALVETYTNLFSIKLNQARWADASEDIEDPFLYNQSDLIGVR